MRGLHREPLGVDFAAALAQGLRDRMAGEPPEAMARVTLLVNTSRMARRTEAALAAGGPTLMPRIGLVSDLSPLLPPGEAPAPGVSDLGMRLRLTALVEPLLQARPDLSPPSAAFDLAGSLGKLLAEMQEGRIPAERLAGIDVGDLSEHWKQTLPFLRIATDWLDRTGDPTRAAAQDAALDRLLARWRDAPPADPVIVAGSTASRAPTRRLIAGVLALRQGVVVLPGLDGDMPDAAWDALAGEDGRGPEDHPQYRLAALLREHGVTRADAPRWSRIAPACPPRNRLISLALRPAPATDAWREEGPALGDVARACADVTLLAAPSPGMEAAAIACGLRAALAEGRRAALITPDRNLSRQVAARLDGWGIVPDDSAGRPLSQTAPGRLLLHVAQAHGPRIEAETLAILLGHPLAGAGGDRADHLRRARALEVGLLRGGPQPFPDRAAIDGWMTAEDEGLRAPGPWSAWLGDLLDALAHRPETATLAEHVAGHVALTEALVRGTGADAGPLWQGEAGRAAKAAMDRLRDGAPERGEAPLPAADYVRILRAVLGAEEVRETYAPHPDAMIWGAIEARVRSADLVILGGLTDDVWPGHPAPDPWLNRAMRAQVGLAPPERETGLSAHDFQQAAAGREIWLSRSLRTAEADTVPSRWLNRIEGLLAGIGPEGRAALDAMRARGARWLGHARALDAPVRGRHPYARAPRPAPRLPAGTGPERLSVTAIETLIRDPYAIYARHYLRLFPMPPLRQGPDARIRGVAVHDAMEAFARTCPGALPPDAADRLRDALETALGAVAPWPGARRMWLGKFDRVLPDLLAAEAARRALGRPLHVEAKGELAFVDPPFVLTARADRIDARDDGLAIYDYKTGAAPTRKQQAAFAKQLPLEALMAREGAFAGVPPAAIADLAYLSIGATYAETRPEAWDAAALDDVRAGLVELVRRYHHGQPFVARLAPDLLSYASDYDQVARFGEWDDTDTAIVLPVGA